MKNKYLIFTAKQVTIEEHHNIATLGGGVFMKVRNAKSI
jgi:hypothetical protein